MKYSKWSQCFKTSIKVNVLRLSCRDWSQRCRDTLVNMSVWSLVGFSFYVLGSDRQVSASALIRRVELQHWNYEHTWQAMGHARWLEKKETGTGGELMTEDGDTAVGWKDNRYAGTPPEKRGWKERGLGFRFVVIISSLEEKCRQTWTLKPRPVQGCKCTKAYVARLE